MIRCMLFGIVLCFFVGGTPSGVLAQGYPRWKGPDPNDPRTVRSRRERAVAHVGPVARDFVEAYGDDAVAAIFAVSKAVGVKLAEFHNAGELAKLPSGREMLRLIAMPRHRDDVAVWMIQHAAQLQDVDHFNAYMMNPLIYAMNLKSLEVGASEAKVWRLNQPMEPPGMMTQFTDQERQALAAAAVVFLIGAIIVWRRWKSRVC